MPPPPPEVWGPPAWARLHALPALLGPAPGPAARARARDRFWGEIYAIPCPACLGHATAFLRRTPPPFARGPALAAFLEGFHDDVNRRLGKPLRRAGRAGRGRAAPRP